MTAPTDQKQLWEESFDEAIERQAYNTAAVEALVRTVSYYLRERYQPSQYKQLHFLEMGCGAGPNLAWLAQKGIRVSGVDLAANALRLARESFDRAGLGDRVAELVEGSVTKTPFPDESFDGILEACVFQHLDAAQREQAFGEVRRLLKKGGVFVGYMLDAGHTIYRDHQAEERADDRGTLMLADGSSKIHLSNIGTAHFYRREEFDHYLRGFSIIDPCLTTYYLPRSEARKRGYEQYLQSMWTVYAVK
jgi:ubiquinone/menaquinone biosynthesis C-methylase UbiE